MYKKREGCKMLLVVRVARIIQIISTLKPYTSTTDYLKSAMSLIPDHR
jgi:hypothetical protein